MIETLFESPCAIRLSGSIRGAGSPGHVTMSGRRVSERSWTFMGRPVSRTYRQNSRDDHCGGRGRANLPRVGCAPRGTLHPRVRPPLPALSREVPGASAPGRYRAAVGWHRVVGTVAWCRQRGRTPHRRDHPRARGCEAARGSGYLWGGPRERHRARVPPRVRSSIRRTRGRGRRHHDDRRLGSGDDRRCALGRRRGRRGGRPRRSFRRRGALGRAQRSFVAPRYPLVHQRGVPALREGDPRDASRHHSCSGRCITMKDLYRLARTLVWLAFFGALYQELKKPDAERTWHGKVAGVVPYDFRLPTFERLREAYWNPDSDQIFSERVFGVGWAVNIPVAAQRVAALVDQYADASRSLRAPKSLRKRSSSRELE